jgi:hypothetical protein
MDPNPMMIRPAMTNENWVVLAPQADTMAPTEMKMEQMTAA